MIQKRVRVVLMIVVIAFLLTACRSTGKPDNVSDPAYNAGLRAIQIADNYLDYKITREEAKEQMDEIYSRNPYDKDNYSGDSGVEIYVDSVYLSFGSSFGRNSDGIEANVLTARNQLAEKINQPKR